MQYPHTRQAKSERGTSVLRQQNREMIASIILQNAPITRGTISELTGLTGAAVSRITRELIDSGLIAEGDAIATPKRVGRREFELVVNPEGAYFLGISITANRRNVCLADATGRILEIADCSDLSFADPQNFLDELSARTLALVDSNDLDKSRLLGAGVSMAMSSGIADGDTVQTVDSRPLGWTNVPVQSMLTDKLQMPVVVEHRASALLRGEIRAGHRSGSVYLVNAALGFGSSAYFNGQFFVSGDPGFGSISNFVVDPSDHSGASKRLEDAASGLAVIRKLYGEVSVPADALRQAISEANSGDINAKSAFNDAGRALGTALLAVATLMAPQTIVLAGEVGRQNDFHSGVEEVLKALPEIELARSDISSEDSALSVAMHNLLAKVGAI